MMSFAQWGNALYSGDKSYKVVGHRKIFVGLAAAVLVVSALIVGIMGLNRSIEFTGGSQFTVVGAADTSEITATDAVNATGVAKEVRATQLGASGVRVQTESLDSADTATVRDALAAAYDVPAEDVQSESIGPSWGQDVTAKALKSLVIFLALVMVLMTIYFRSWTMSVSAIVALLHDVAFTIGFFALTRVEVSPASVIGFLTILGYSLYDTVVVFDKVRELTHDVYDQKRFTFGELVNLAVNQTMVRSINTSIVALLPVGAILFIGSFLLGAGTLTDISLALFVGMIAGTYSSIFIASPLLVTLQQTRKRTHEHTDMVLASRARAAAQAEGAEATAGEAVPAGTADVKVAPVRPGHRLPNSAQPRRKQRK